MTHEGFPTLISLEFTHYGSGEDSSLRWWLVGSMGFHILVALLALNLRISPTLDQPSASYEVSLVSSSVFDPPSRPKAKTKPSRQKTKPVRRAKAKAVKPPPPLPTTPARERLSESFADSVKTIVVPQTRQRETITPYEPMPVPASQPDVPIQQKIEPEPVQVPDQVQQETTSFPSKSDVHPTTQDLLQGIKPPPKTPNLTPVDPFDTNQESYAIQKPSEQLTDSFKETIQSVQIPTRPKRKEPQKVRQESKSITQSHRKPEPPRIEKTTPQETKKAPIRPQQERLSDSLNQLLESVSVPKFREIPPAESAQHEIKESLDSIQMPKIAKHVPDSKPEKSKPRPMPEESNTLRTEIDQQLAKLKIPDVVPIESLRKRLQIQEVTTSESSDPQASSASPSTKGDTSRKSRYLALVKAQIDQLWVAPPVAVEDKDLQAILQFRILRSGEVKNLKIERGSGNAYYDSAARRAVQGADPLPSFPAEISENYLDVHFSFSVEESM